MGVVRIPIAFAVGCLAAQAALCADERLRMRVEALAIPEAAEVGPVTLARTADLATVYRQLGFNRIWTDPGQESRWQDLLTAIEGAADHGLDPADYHLAALRSTMARARTEGTRLDRELLASDAFLTLAAHYTSGKVNPTRLFPDWKVTPRTLDLAPVLLAVAAGESPQAALKTTLPSFPDYAALTVRYRELKEGEDDEPAPVPAGAVLKPGQTDQRVPLLRARLAWLDDLDVAQPTNPELFDAELEAAVRSFQEQHGLEVDGAVGNASLAMLNLTRQQRLDQVRVNLERWRWLPATFGQRHIRVNIADYSLVYQAPDQEPLRLRAIAGRPYRKTPVFSSTMTYLVLNPAWSVPPRLAVQDLLPELQRDPAAVEARGFTVLRGWGAEQERYAPTEIDWSQYARGHFPFHLRQAPGELNALGQVKFMFPNPHNVYIHDTPAREHFGKAMRALSSGCIRVQDALLLAERVLADQHLDTTALLARATSAAAEHVVVLKQPLPVHILYFTVWLDQDGALQWRPDVYQRDSVVLEALGKL